MKISAAPQFAPPRRLPSEAKPPTPPPTPPNQPDHNLELIDTLKRRSSLVNMLDPVGMTLGLVCTPRQTWGELSNIGGHLIHGQTGAAQTAIEGLVHRAVNPTAPFSYLYRGGQWAGAGIDGTIGALEIRQGLNSNNKPMVAMGVADFIGGTSSAAVAAGFPGTSLAMTVCAAALKTGLVACRPHDFTQIQRMKTVFDAGFAVSSSMLRAGVGVVPALCIQSALGLTELAYMNHTGFREKTDQAVYWLVDKLNIN
ncbi:MAG: hypothetical protein U0931_19865 [Vulcanimicrobiota bacterium]